METWQDHHATPGKEGNSRQLTWLGVSLWGEGSFTGYNQHPALQGGALRLLPIVYTLKLLTAHGEASQNLQNHPVQLRFPGQRARRFK